jgi:hypothetical protein
MGKSPGQDFINQIDGPKDPVNNEPGNGVIIIPAYQHGINPE